MPKASKKQLEYIKQYDKKTYKTIGVKFKINELELIKSYCDAKNLSFNGFVTSTLMKAVLSDDGIDEE